MAFRNFNQQLLEARDLQRLIEKEIIEGRVTMDALPKSLADELFADGMYGDEIRKTLEKDIVLRAKLIAKWCVNRGSISHSGDLFVVSCETFTVQVRAPWILRQVIEGESKKLYRIVLPHDNQYFQHQVVILLKSTIYSHTNQHTGIIENLAKVRAVGSAIFVDLMMRNDLQHAYRCITPDGVILSDFKDITPLEVVFKKYWVGTDKHSYYALDSTEYGEKIVHHCNNEGMYSSGVYVRFDWRNPNHISVKTRRALSENPHYYTLEEYVGKDRFFEEYIHDAKKCKPFGDKCIYPDLVSGICELPTIRKNVVKLYCTFKHYLDKVGLELIDGCFMLDRTGSVFWSEINPDCMRIRASSMDVKYDKDIWRAGGSSSKEEIMKKWTLLNELLMDYLKKHRFHETELHEYNSLPHQQEAEAILHQKDI